MTEDFKDRFRKDRELARADKQLELGRQQLVAGGQHDLWKKLRDHAHAEVSAINSNDQVLMFSDNDLGEEMGFIIIYNREGEQRKASATFRSATHAVEVKISHAAAAPKFYKIVAKNSDLKFELKNVPKSPEDIVADIFSNLLMG
jgi:hypothetical protein